MSWAELGGRAELGGPSEFELGAPAGRAQGVLGGFWVCVAHGGYESSRELWFTGRMYSMRMYSSSTAEYFGSCIGRCLSPIEQRFLSALFFMTDNAWMPAVYTPTIAMDLNSGIRLQFQVPVEQYKVDFVMVTRYERKFAIEIDGYIYHGATPEQFTNDSMRQRFITERGYTFLRFSGQEIERDPVKVAREAMTCVRNASLASAQASAREKKERFDKFGQLSWEEQMAIASRVASRKKADQGLAPREEDEITDDELAALGFHWRGRRPVT